MNRPADGRLQRLLGGEHLAALRRRLRRRFERAPAETPLDRFRIDRLSAEEHAALAALVGRPQRYAGSLGIDVRAVDLALQQSGIARSLREALERLDGPIADPTGERIRLEALWSAVAGGCGDPGLATLLREPAGLGLLKRLARQDPAAAAELCRRADAVLRRLPANGATRSQLAAELLGDAHALDTGQPVATLVLAVQRRRAAAGRAEEVPVTGPAGEIDSQQMAERIRDIWAAAGVLVNELARPALFLNLPIEGGGEQDRGDPAYTSLRSLLRSPPRWDVAGRAVHVCENPNLVAIAADRLGAGCAPLLCTDGMPGAAQRTLLCQLRRAGARLRYHGDFDWPGLRIANHMLQEHDAQPWRLGAADYLAAVQRAPRERPSLPGKPVAASWDAALTAAMERWGVPVAEEALADELLADLDCR